MKPGDFDGMLKGLFDCVVVRRRDWDWCNTHNQSAHKCDPACYVDDGKPNPHSVTMVERELAHEDQILPGGK